MTMADADPISRNSPNTKRDRIDLHHHYFPKAAKDVLPPFPPIQGYALEKSLAGMDEAGVRTACLSLPCPLGDDPEKTRAKAPGFAREVNEAGARIASDHRGRFGLFAFLPLPHIDASLREIEYVFDTLHADGVGILTNYGNRWLGDPVFQPVFDELNRRNAVVFAHPIDAPCCRGLLPNTMQQTVEWNTNTSRALWSLLNDGTDLPPMTTPMTSMATRYGNIRFVWSHAGGSLLGLIGRFLGRSSMTQKVDLSPDAEPNSKLYHLRRFYYDTAGSANPIQMHALKSLVGTSQIVFGSDFPIVPVLETVEALQECGFSVEELENVNYANALRILPERSSSAQLEIQRTVNPARKRPL